MSTVIYLHGKDGNADESAHYRPLFPHADVIGLDYKATTPWEAKEELGATFEKVCRDGEIILIANSIGAFFAMYAGIERYLKKAYFISPMVDLEGVILRMMRSLKITEEELAARRTIQTPFGEDLSWEYLSNIRQHPIVWHTPTHILYGEKDELTPPETIAAFAKAHKATLTILPGGEHWFHTKEQMQFLDNWIKEKEKP